MNRLWVQKGGILHRKWPAEPQKIEGDMFIDHSGEAGVITT